MAVGCLSVRSSLSVRSRRSKMSTVKFAEEFMHLIRSWTRSPVLSKDGAAILAPLTKRELVNTIKLVVQMMLGVYLHETTQAGIATSRPSSLGERYRSMDDLLPSSNSSNVRSLNAILASQSPYMKVISQSSPTIDVSFLDRPDAPIREQAERGALHITTKQQGDIAESRVLLDKVKLLRTCATDIVSKMDELRKVMPPESRIPRLRLPPIAASPGPSGSSSLPRKVPRSILRKPSSGFSGTSATKNFEPTLTTDEENAAAIRHARASGSIFIKPLDMLPRSPLPSVAGSTTKKSTPSTRPTAKTPKSVPIRSTISKFTRYRKS